MLLKDIRKFLRPIIKEAIKEMMPVIKEIAIASAKEYVRERAGKREKGRVRGLNLP